MNSTNQWKVSVFKCIQNIADLEYQKHAWTGNHPIFESSFIETYNSLYNDLDFEYFDNYKQYFNSDRLIAKLDELCVLLGSYEEGSLTDIEILSDPSWVEISKLASEVIDTWLVEA